MLKGIEWTLPPFSPNLNYLPARFSSNEDVDYPNLMFHFLPVAIRYDDTLPSSRHGYQVHVGLMYTDARGSVKIKLTDPAVDSLSVLVGAIWVFFRFPCRLHALTTLNGAFTAIRIRATSYLATVLNHPHKQRHKILAMLIRAKSNKRRNDLTYAVDEKIDEFARLVAAILRRLDKEREAYRSTQKSKQQEEDRNAASH